MIVAFDLFLFQGEYELLKKLAKQVYETDWRRIENVDPDEDPRLRSKARFALLVGDGWVAHVRMYYAEEIEDDCIKLAEWSGDEVKVIEEYIDDYPIEDIKLDEPRLYCDDEENRCEAEVSATYRRKRTYATIFIDFSKNVPREVIEIAIKGYAEQTQQTQQTVVVQTSPPTITLPTLKF